MKDHEADWMSGGKSASGDCVVADQTNGYKWTRTPCTSQATHFCEPEPALCPDGYLWTAEGDRASCYRIHEPSSTKQFNETQTPGIAAASKSCSEDGTRLALPSDNNAVEAIKVWMQSHDQVFSGEIDDDNRELEVFLGLRFFKQKDILPSDCANCKWNNGFYSPWTQKMLINTTDNTLFGTNIESRCITIKRYKNNVKTVQQGNCYSPLDSYESKTNIRGLCEYKECRTTSNKVCKFPFHYAGRKYDTCITLGSTNGLPWCSTSVDSMGLHVHGSEETCAATCPVTNCPVGFWPHYSTCIQDSPGQEEYAVTSVDEAEQNCFKQGARLFQPRSDRTMNALKVKEPSVYDSGINHVGAYGWTSNQQRAIGIIVNHNTGKPLIESLYYRDGSQVSPSMANVSFPWKTPDYPNQNTTATCLTLIDKENGANTNCTGYATGYGEPEPLLSYVCEARPLQTIAGHAPFQACHFPFKANVSASWSHSCIYDKNKYGIDIAWCATKVDADGIMINGEWGLCEDERNTVVSGPGEF